MKEGWEYKKLGDVCEILDSRRKPITKNKRESGTIPYYGATGLLDYVKNYIFNEKLVLLGEDGAKWNAGENSAYIIEGKSWVNNHAHALRPKRDLLIDELLVYYLNFSNLLPYITGVTVPKLNQEKMRSIEIPIGPVKEQQSIVDYLDSAFAKIDAMKANAEKALNEAKALFQASLKEMLEPKEGWEYSTIGNLCNKMNGLWKGKTKPFVNVGVIRNANFTKSFTLSFDNIEYLDVEAKQYKTRKLQKGDLIVEKSGGSEKQPVGRTVLFDKEDGEYSFSNFTSVLRIKDRNVISPEFLYRYILYVYLRGDTRKMQKATTGIHNIEFDKFLAIPVPKLHLSEQQSIVDYLDTLGIKVDRLQENYDKISQECDALKQAILRQVFE